jgi:hypothetical protein
MVHIRAMITRRPFTQQNVSRYIPIIAPLVLYPLIAVMITFPLITQLSTHMAGPEYTDATEFVRWGWWTHYAWINGWNPFDQVLLEYPNGMFSTTQVAQPLAYIPIALLNYVVNPIAAYNLYALLIIVLNGIAAYILCLDLTRSVLPALLGGVIFMAYPSMQGHYIAGHLNPQSLYALPIVLLTAFRILSGRGGIWVALLGAVALWVLKLGNYVALVYAVLPLVIFGGLYVLLVVLSDSLRSGKVGSARRAEWQLTPRAVRDLLIMGGVAVILILPFYIPLIREALDPNRAGYLLISGNPENSAEPLAYVLLSPDTPWTAPITSARNRELIDRPNEVTAYMGMIAVALAGIALLARTPRSGFLIAVAIPCAVLALGPVLKWFNDPLIINGSTITLPWALFENLPGINVTRTPGRFNMTVGLMLAVLAAHGLAYLFTRFDALRRARIAVTMGLIVLILAEYQVMFPFPTSTPLAPELFAQLRDHQDIRAVLELPMDDPIAQRHALMNQVAHHKPLIAGYVVRATAADPVMLDRLQRAAFGFDGISVDEARRVLREAGADVIVIHWRELIARKEIEQVQAFTGRMYGEPLYADEVFAVYLVPESAP